MSDRCYTCNGWNSVSGLSMRETKGMVCQTCGRDYSSPPICRHCGRSIRTGEAGVRPWIHTNGWYRCIPFDTGTLADHASATDDTPGGGK